MNDLLIVEVGDLWRAEVGGNEELTLRFVGGIQLHVKLNIFYVGLRLFK